MVYYKDFYDSAEVVAQLPTGGAVLSDRPTAIKVQIADVTKQESDTTPVAGPHQNLTVFLWFPKANNFLPAAVFTSDIYGHEIGKPMMENTPIWIRDSSGNTIMQNVFTPSYSNPPKSPVTIEKEKDKMTAKLDLLGNYALIDLPFSRIPADHPNESVRRLRNLDDVQCKIPSMRIAFHGLENSFQIEKTEATLPSGWQQVITPEPNHKAGFAWVDFEMLPRSGYSIFHFAGTMRQNMTRTITK